MGDAGNYLIKLYSRFQILDRLLKEILREEQLLEKDLLVKSGFLIRRYSLRLDKLNLPLLERLKEEFLKVKAIETEVQYEIRQGKDLLSSVEKGYNAYYREELRLRIILIEYMNQAFYSAQAAYNLVHQLTELLTKNAFVLRKVGLQTKRLIGNLEIETTKVKRLIDALGQLSSKVMLFERQEHFDFPRQYGRAMSKSEMKITKAKKALTGSPKREEGDLIGVFDCPPEVLGKLKSMDDDQRKTFFGRIGVSGATKIIFFETKLKPKVGPIPQTNGLIEYKFPKGTPIELLEAA